MRPTATYHTSEERVEVEDMFHRKIATQIQRVAARHNFPFRLSSRPKKIGFLTSHLTQWHKEASDSHGRSSTYPPRNGVSEMSKIHGPLVCKTRRGGTRGPGTHPPKKWHSGARDWMEGGASHSTFATYANIFEHKKEVVYGSSKDMQGYIVYEEGTIA